MIQVSITSRNSAAPSRLGITEAINLPSDAMTWLGRLCDQDGTQLPAITLLGEMEDQACPVAVRSGCTLLSLTNQIGVLYLSPFLLTNLFSFSYGFSVAAPKVALNRRHQIAADLKSARLRSSGMG